MNEEQMELLVETIMRKIEKANLYFLKEIGKDIKMLKSLTKDKAHELEQILLYGGRYEEIIKKLSDITNLNEKEINDIFLSYAKQDQKFYKNFYSYKNKPFVPITKNPILLNQTLSLAKATRNQYLNFTYPKLLGYSIRDENNKLKFLGLKETYEKILNEAILNSGQGKQTFDESIEKILKNIGGSGLKTIDYESGKSIRLDSVIRQHLMGALRELHNANEEIIGNEIDFDGYEISVHEFPADDHAEAQGRQFTIEQYINLQNDGICKDVTGKTIDLHKDDKSATFRPISRHNCYHVAYSIIIGVNEPQYSEKELNDIIERNEKGIEYENKKYTMYEATQKQRQIEREIRKNKDLLELGQASDNKLLIEESESNITILVDKYRKFCNISGLPPKLNRLKLQIKKKR